MKLIWETPAPKKMGRKSKNEKIVAALKANPGQWARVAEGRGSSVSWFKNHGCEATGRSQPDGTVYTYARWPQAGEGKDPQPAPVKKTAPAEAAAEARAAVTGESTGNCPCGRRRVAIKDGRCRTCRTNARIRQVSA